MTTTKKTEIILVAILFLLFSQNMSAQNLIPNGDFESHHTCDSTYGAGQQIDSAVSWFKVCASGTSDYFNVCNGSVPDNFAGTQSPHSGSGYAGLYAWLSMGSGIENYREYIEAPLASPLVANTTYHFSMYVNFAETYPNFTTKNIGAYFSDSIIHNLPLNTALGYIPQVENTSGFISQTVSWVLVEGDFMAHGGEKYVIIGNLNDYAHTDTMAIIALPSAFLATYFYIDDVSLTTKFPNETEEATIKNPVLIYPNPTNDFITINLTSNSNIKIMNSIGQVVYANKHLNNHVQIDFRNQAKGIYFVEINGSEKRKNYKIVKQ